MTPGRKQDKGNNYLPLCHLKKKKKKLSRPLKAYLSYAVLCYHIGVLVFFFQLNSIYPSKLIVFSLLLFHQALLYLEIVSDPPHTIKFLFFFFFPYTWHYTKTFKTETTFSWVSQNSCPCPSSILCSAMSSPFLNGSFSLVNEVTPERQNFTATSS